MNPLVSVVIPACNAVDFIEECLASVRAQHFGESLEIIVVDDGSTDGTADKLRGIAGLTCLAQRNRGPAAARNLGVGQARGRYIAFLDADDLWPRDTLRKRLDLLQRHPDAALCFGDCRQFEGDRLRPQTLFEEGGFAAEQWGTGPYLPQDAYARLLTENFITTGSVVLRKGVLDELGGFDESLRLVEDLELWLRIVRRYPVIWSGEVCLLRRRHAGNTSREQDAMSLAYLHVLKQQQDCCKEDLVRLGVDVKGLYAREYQTLADHALAEHRTGNATHWAWQSFLARPGLRPLWRLLQGAGRQLGRRAG